MNVASMNPFSISVADRRASSGRDRARGSALGGRSERTTARLHRPRIASARILIVATLREEDIEQGSDLQDHVRSLTTPRSQAH